jgi:hypothetical protein
MKIKLKYSPYLAFGSIIVLLVLLFTLANLSENIFEKGENFDYIGIKQFDYMENTTLVNDTIYFIGFREDPFQIYSPVKQSIYLCKYKIPSGSFFWKKIGKTEEYEYFHQVIYGDKVLFADESSISTYSNENFSRKKTLSFEDGYINFINPGVDNYNTNSNFLFYDFHSPRVFFLRCCNMNLETVYQREIQLHEICRPIAYNGFIYDVQPVNEGLNVFKVGIKDGHIDEYRTYKEKIPEQQYKEPSVSFIKKILIALKITKPAEIRKTIAIKESENKYSYSFEDPSVFLKDNQLYILGFNNAFVFNTETGIFRGVPDIKDHVLVNDQILFFNDYCKGVIPYPVFALMGRKLPDIASMAKCDRNNDCLLITFFKKTGYLRVYIKNDQAYIIPEDLLYEDYTFNDKYIVSSNGKEIFILKVDKLNKVGEEQKK